MKKRTATKSSSRTRGSMATKRSRSMLPAATRRPKRGGTTNRQKRTGVSAKRKTSTRSSARPSSGRRSSSRMRAGSAKAKTSHSRSANRGGSGTSGSARTTSDHDEIRQWVESHGGKPATVKGTVRGKDPAGLLRIDFPGYSGRQSLKPISWNQFFRVFDERKLALLYQGGKKSSRFNKLVCRTA